MERKGCHGTRYGHIHTFAIPPPMSLLAAVRRQSATFVCASCRTRTYAAKAGKKDKTSTQASSTKLPPAETIYSTFQSRSVPSFACLWLRVFLDGTSSCPPGTILTGLNYLKGQTQVVALPDEEYPPWLWKLLERRDLVDDGPGGKVEKIRLRKENRQRIRDQNLLKTQ